MIREIRANGFKSLHEFKMELGEFNCLIGKNGAGKSTLLQVIDFAASLASFRNHFWFESRCLTEEEIGSNVIPRRKSIDITIFYDFKGESGVLKTYGWRVTFARGSLMMRSELFAEVNKGVDGKWKTVKNIFQYKNSSYQFYGEGFSETPFVTFGSAIANLASQKNFSQIEIEHLQAFKALGGMKSFDLLAPNLLRKKQKKDSSIADIGLGGEFLGAFVHNLNVEQREQLLADVRSFYPDVQYIQTKARRFGWIDLIVHEKVVLDLPQLGGRVDHTMQHTAKVLNDGMLRIIAILAQKYSPYGVIMFDEIENGVNSEITKKVVDVLLSLDKQVIVTTHSPMVLNYIPEEIAKDSVHLFFKEINGATQQTKFFDIPSVRDKLDFLAPGDAMLDVYLDEVSDEAKHIRDLTEVKVDDL